MTAARIPLPVAIALLAMAGAGAAWGGWRMAAPAAAPMPGNVLVDPEQADDPAEAERLTRRIAELRALLAARALPEAPVAASAPIPAPAHAPSATAPPAPATPPPVTTPAMPMLALDTPVLGSATDPDVSIGIEIDPADPRVLLAWSTSGLLRRTRDGGATWTSERPPTPITLGPHLYRGTGTWFIGAAGTDAGHAAVGLLSGDLGASWQAVARPWPDGAGQLAVQAAVLTPQDGLVLAQSLGPDSDSVRFWRSADRGRTWTSEAPQEGFHTLLVAGAGAVALFKRSGALLEMSSDLGRTRKKQLNSLEHFTTRPVRWDRQESCVLLTDHSSHGQVSRVADRGTIDYTYMPGFPDLFDQRMRPLVTSFATDPVTATIWFAAAPRLGLIRSDNNGTDWYAFAEDKRVERLVIRRCGTRTMLAATGVDTVVLDITDQIGTWHLFRTSLDAARARVRERK